MSEKIYAWLLRLYPPQFREAYGEEALQLFRDRARDERGFFPRLRLWFDLLADLAISVPREYCHAQPALIGTSVQQRSDCTPSFQVLEGRAPRFGALLFGGVLSLAALAGTTDLTSHTGDRRPLRAWGAQPQHPAYARSSAFGRPAQSADYVEEEIIASQQPTMDAGRLGHGDAEPSGSQWRLLSLQGGPGSPQSQAPQPRPQGATSPVLEGVKLDAAERQRVIDGAIANLKKYYIDPDVALQTADALLAHEKSGDDDSVTDGWAFADLLSKQMTDVSHDLHLVVVYNQVNAPERPREPTPEEFARYRKEMEEYNCTFEKVRILPHNIGYVKLNSFPDPSVCRPRAAAAMASLNHADAIIFDLRDNGGGYASMVALLATYLFDHPTHLNDFYTRGDNTTEQSWTLPPVPGNRLADKPTYVLTSASTFSAAEAFSYDLKMLKRATIVGETTSGRGHMGSRHRIDDHFEIRVPGIRAINPISKTNWAGTGVEPDVKVKAADALQTAEKLAESRLHKK